MFSLLCFALKTNIGTSILFPSIFGNFNAHYESSFFVTLSDMPYDINVSFCYVHIVAHDLPFDQCVGYFSSY